MEVADLSLSPIVVWVIALSQLLTFGLTVWGLMSSGHKVHAGRIESHSKRLDEHDLRLGGIEYSQRSVPSKDDMHSVSLSLEAMKGELKAIRAEMEGRTGIMERLEAIVSRHENHLLEGKR